MADIAQVLATYDGLVGVALGAGLTYVLGALNRRHQEAREDKTRWYEARFQAYAELAKAFSNCLRVAWNEADMKTKEDVVQELSWAAGALRLVGSGEVVKEAELIVSVLVHELQSESPVNVEITREVFLRFEAAARKDLGHAFDQ